MEEDVFNAMDEVLNGVKFYVVYTANLKKPQKIGKKRGNMVK